MCSRSLGHPPQEGKAGYLNPSPVVSSASATFADFQQELAGEDEHWDINAHLQDARLHSA